MDYSSPEATAQSPSPQPQKFMRYRSVRKAVADPPSQRSPPPLPQAVPETVATNPTNLTRLPSRYHRRPPAPSGLHYPYHVRSHSRITRRNSPCRQRQLSDTPYSQIIMRPILTTKVRPSRAGRLSITTVAVGRDRAPDKQARLQARLESIRSPRKSLYRSPLN
jgi:hypothetical protein